MINLGPIPDHGLLKDHNPTGCGIVDPQRIPLRNSPKELDGLAPEAGQARVEHELDQVDEGVGVGPDHQVGLYAQLLEPPAHSTISTNHQCST